MYSPPQGDNNRIANAENYQDVHAWGHAERCAEGIAQRRLARSSQAGMRSRMRISIVGSGSPPVCRCAQSRPSAECLLTGMAIGRSRPIPVVERGMIHCPKAVTSHVARIGEVARTPRGRISAARDLSYGASCKSATAPICAVRFIARVNELGDVFVTAANRAATTVRRLRLRPPVRKPGNVENAAPKVCVGAGALDRAGRRLLLPTRKCRSRRLLS